MLLLVLYLVAIAAVGVTAALAAGRSRMDWVGVCLLACVTALGGGSCRDILLGRYPLSWVAHPYYLAVTTAAALATILFARWMRHLHAVFLVLDAVGLVVFTVIGCNAGLEFGTPTPIVIVSGMVTGCVGGVLRDILCNQVPLVFRSELYASVSVLTGCLYVAGRSTALPAEAVMLGSMAVGLTLRLLALRFNWHMPRFIYNDDET